MFSASALRLNIVDRPLAKGKAEVRFFLLLMLRQDCLQTSQPPALGVQVSLSAFAFLFSEIVQYSQTRVSNIGELERRCAALSQRALFLSLVARLQWELGVCRPLLFTPPLSWPVASTPSLLAW